MKNIPVILAVAAGMSVFKYAVTTMFLRTIQQKMVYSVKTKSLEPSKILTKYRSKHSSRHEHH